MSGILLLPGVGRATMCSAAGKHTPLPVRFVWHHVLPLEAGGKSVPANLVQVCDNCHYTIHRLMWWLAHPGAPGAAITVGMKRTQRYVLALAGYQAAVAAGTVGLIPNEG